MRNGLLETLQPSAFRQYRGVSNPKRGPPHQPKFNDQRFFGSFFKWNLLLFAFPLHFDGLVGSCNVAVVAAGEFYRLPRSGADGVDKMARTIFLTDR